MRRLTAVILFTLFNLGAFGVTIEQHLCCHANQESSLDHCNNDESCCDDVNGCCDEIVSQVKIAKDFTLDNFKINLDIDHIVEPVELKFYALFIVDSLDPSDEYAALGYFPPPKDFQVSFSTFLI